VVGEDYSGRFSKQIQFNPGEYTKTWTLRLLDDEIYEQKEMLTLELSEPIGTVLEQHMWATVTITDPEDRPKVSLVSGETIELNENVGRASVPVSIL